MKLRSVLLACLLLTAVFNSVLDFGQQARLAAFDAALGRMGLSGAADPAASDAGLEAVDDPAALRKMVRAERARRENERRLPVALLESVRRMNTAAIWRGVILCALALAATAAMAADRQNR